MRSVDGQEEYGGPGDKDGNSLEGKAEIIIGRKRNGTTGVVNMFVNKAFTLFEGFSARKPPE